MRKTHVCPKILSFELWAYLQMGKSSPLIAQSWLNCELSLPAKGQIKNRYSRCCMRHGHKALSRATHLLSRRKPLAGILQTRMLCQGGIEGIAKGQQIYVQKNSAINENSVNYGDFIRQFVEVPTVIVIIIFTSNHICFIKNSALIHPRIGKNTIIGRIYRCIFCRLPTILYICGKI